MSGLRILRGGRQHSYFVFRFQMVLRACHQTGRSPGLWWLLNYRVHVLTPQRSPGWVGIHYTQDAERRDSAAQDGRSSPPTSTAPGPASWPSGDSAARLLMARQLGVSGGGRGPGCDSLSAPLEICSSTLSAKSSTLATWHTLWQCQQSGQCLTGIYCSLRSGWGLQHRTYGDYFLNLCSACFPIN